MHNNILIPRNLYLRKEKLYQHNIKLLCEEIIECEDFIIDDTFEGIPLELIKVKEIKGDVYLRIGKGYIPSWLKNVKIYGNFWCTFNNLKTLENCPYYINKNLICSYNQLISIKDCPKYIGKNFINIGNNKKFKLPKKTVLILKYIDKLNEI